MGREGTLAVALGLVLALGTLRAWPRGAAPERPVPAGPYQGGALRVLGLPLEVNSATEADLETLPGVGPTLAARIVADRAAHGPFPSLAALGRVPGIGPGKLRLLAGRAVVRAAP